MIADAAKPLLDAAAFAAAELPDKLRVGLRTDASDNPPAARPSFGEQMMQVVPHWATIGTGVAGQPLWTAKWTTRRGTWKVTQGGKGCPTGGALLTTPYGDLRLPHTPDVAGDVVRALRGLEGNGLTDPLTDLRTTYTTVPAGGSFTTTQHRDDRTVR